MVEFYNPYQFIPTDTQRAPGKVSYRSLDDLKRDDNRFVRHDYFHRDGFTGKLKCTLSTLSAVVIGAVQRPGQSTQPGVVAPYRIQHDEETCLAIPGNTLRGMIGNIAEILSQSSLRVLSNLEEGAMSVRKPARGGQGPDRALSDLGVLCNHNGEWTIFPLHYGRSVGDYSRAKSNDAHDKTIKSHTCFQLHHNDHRTTAGGIYYLRGQMKDGNEKAPDKRRETFFPSHSLDGIDNRSQHIHIDAKAVEICERILRDRYQQTVKSEQDHQQSNLLPTGYRDDGNRRGWTTDRPILCDGDLIYYRQEGTTVVELSYSRIWRRQLPGDLATAFTRHAGTDALPWSADRSTLTPVEAMFGVTEDRDSGQIAQESTRNLASRVRFCDARCSSAGILHEPVTLKALSSPKPPSPAMYFCADGKLREKTQLNLAKDAPNGRKYYLPHPHSLALDKGINGHWVTQTDKRPHLKMQCQPIAKDEQFVCEIHFENLSAAELGLLRYALQPNGATEQFIHRVGLGKPLGLGHVAFTNVEVYLVDRPALYQAIPDATRLNSFPYQQFSEAPEDTLIDPTALQTLKQLADPENVGTVPVCYPFLSRKGQAPYNEEDGYQWFSANEQPLCRDPVDGTDLMQPLKS